jgi:RNA polymerase sigma factor (sigma-70 family)
VTATLSSTEARNALVEANLPLVLWTLNRCVRPALLARLEDDLAQVGALALMRAAERYDPAKGTFGTFAHTCIRHVVLRECHRLRERMAEWIQSSDGEPLDPVDYRQADALPVDTHEEVARLLEHAMPRERAVLVAVVMEGRTMLEVGRAMNVGKVRVGQLCARGLRQIREGLARAPRKLPQGNLPKGNRPKAATPVEPEVSTPQGPEPATPETLVRKLGISPRLMCRLMRARVASLLPV